MEIGDFVSGEAPESVLGTSNEQNVDMDCDGKQKGQVNEDDDEEDEDEDEDEEDEEEECEFRFEDGVNPLDLMEGDASGVPFYQHLEKLEYEALAEKKRKALADNHGEGSTKKARLEDLSGATMEEIMEAMNFGVRRKSRKYKKKGRRKGSKNKLSPEVTRLLGDATLHYARGNYQEAILLLHRIIMQAPELPETYHTLGLVHSALGDDKKSMDFYMLAAQLTPKDPSLWKVLFTRSIEQGDTGRARYCLMRAISRDPKDVTLKSHLASFYEELGDNQKAAESYEQVWQLCPENVEALKKAVKFYQQCGQAESSISILEDYLKGHPVEADFSVIEMLVTILMENKAHNKALNLIEHAHLVYYSGKELPFYLATKAGICHVHLGNMEKAEILFSVLREEKDCDHSDLIMEAANTFMSHGHFDYALKYYLILEENAAGDHGLIYLKIAKAYLALNVRVEAILFFYRALHVHEDSIDARLTLASLLLEECKEDEAILLLSTPKDSDSKDNQCSDKSKPWWLNENVRLKLSHIYRAKGMLEEFVSTILPLVRESLHIEGLQQQKVKGKKKLSSSELHRRVKLLDEPHRDSVFHGFRPVAPSSELMKASRARRLIQKKSALKQKKKAEAMAAGFDWQSGDSEDEFTRSKRQEIKDPPLPNLLKDDEHLCLLIDLGKALASLKRYWEALEIINLTLRLAANALSPEQKEGLRSLGAQIAYNTTDPKHGFDCVKYIVQQHPMSFGAWNCYYKVASRLDSRYSKHYKFHHRMRARYKDYVPPIIIAGHQFTVKSHHQDAAREYLEAYKLLPENPLVNLCVGTALINLALGFRLQNKHQCLAQGLAFLYNNLRLSESSQEALYNIARAYHHVGLVTLAASYYEKVLAIRQKDYPIPKLPNENLDLVDVLQSGYCDLGRDAAYNLHLIYKKSGAVDLASSEVDICKKIGGEWDCIHADGATPRSLCEYYNASLLWK